MLDITIFDGARDTTPHMMQFSWEDICDLFEEASQEDWERSAKLSRLAFCPGLLCGPRAAVNVVHLSFGSYDVDLAGSDPSYIDFPAMRSKLDGMGVAYILATSTKSLAVAHRYRLILRFERPVLADQHLMMWHNINGQFGGIFDRSTHDSSRLSFFPACWIGQPRDTKGELATDWPEQNAYQSFACNRGGYPVPLPDFTTLKHLIAAPDASRAVQPKQVSRGRANSPGAQMLLDQCAAAVPEKSSIGYRLATSPSNDLYLGPQPFGDVPGGRMFRLLCRVAARAFRRRLPINADLLFDLATAVNVTNGGMQRPDLRREVERALVKEAEFIAGA